MSNFAFEDGDGDDAGLQLQQEPSQSSPLLREYFCVRVLLDAMDEQQRSSKVYLNSDPCRYRPPQPSTVPVPEPEHDSPNNNGHQMTRRAFVDVLETFILRPPLLVALYLLDYDLMEIMGLPEGTDIPSDVALVGDL
jgi:hypothetical protein